MFGWSGWIHHSIYSQQIEITKDGGQDKQAGCVCRAQTQTDDIISVGDSDCGNFLDLSGESQKPRLEKEPTIYSLQRKEGNTLGSELRSQHISSCTPRTEPTTRNTFGCDKAESEKRGKIVHLSFQQQDILMTAADTVQKRYRQFRLQQVKNITCMWHFHHTHMSIRRRNVTVSAGARKQQRGKKNTLQK